MAGTYDFTLEKGATFQLQLEWLDSEDVPIDLTSYTARMKLRYKKKAGDVATELTTENGRIILNGATGIIELEIEATETAILDNTNCVYDLELESPGGIVYRVIEGSVDVSEEVTR